MWATRTRSWTASTRPTPSPFGSCARQGGLAGYAHGAGPHFAVGSGAGERGFRGGQSHGRHGAALSRLELRIPSGGLARAKMPSRIFTAATSSDRIASTCNTGPKLDYRKWIADFRAGRSFVTSGPLVFFSVEGKQPGDEIRLPGGAKELKADDRSGIDHADRARGGALQQPRRGARSARRSIRSSSRCTRRWRRIAAAGLRFACAPLTHGIQFGGRILSRRPCPCG